MTVRSAFLFPGLGAYTQGVLRRADEQHPLVRETLTRIDETAQSQGVASVQETLLSGDAVPVHEMLQRPAEEFQLAIFGASLITHRILEAEGIRPYALVGHSFGEIAALVAAGAFSLEDGVRLVCARAQALRSWEGWGAMSAIGAGERVSRHLIGALDDPQLVIACVNAPHQTVISGPLESIAAAEGVAGALGVLTSRLNLPYASHHPAMHPAVLSFAELTADIVQQPMSHPVISPIHGRRYSDSEDLRKALAGCLVLPVRFTDTVRELHSARVTTFIEAGAARALTRCVELTVPGVHTIAPLRDPDTEVEGLRLAVQAATGADGPPTGVPGAPPSSRPAVPSAHPADGPIPSPAPSPILPPRTMTPPATPAAMAPTGEGMLPNPAPGPQPNADAAQPSTSAAAPGSAAPAREDILEQLREMYAQTLEYPPDVLTEDALLEAHLGVDSLKQTALLAKVTERYQLDRNTRMGVIELGSLGLIADFVTANAGGASQ